LLSPIIYYFYYNLSTSDKHIFYNSLESRILLSANQHYYSFIFSTDDGNKTYFQGFHVVPFFPKQQAFKNQKGLAEKENNTLYKAA
jgi:hypothetical protein